MDLAVLATVFGVIFLAELPDKTAVASLVLGTRYHPGPVFAGVAAAFAAHVVLAIVAGSLLGLLPHRVVEVIVAVLFAVGAVLLLRRRGSQDGEAAATDIPGQPAARAGYPLGARGAAGDGAERRGRPGGPRTGGLATAQQSSWRVAATSFGVLFMAEFGDLTQVVIANLAARYHQPLAVGVGALAAMWAVGALAIFGGRQLLRLVPVTWISRAAGIAMAVLAALSLLDAVTG